MPTNLAKNLCYAAALGMLIALAGSVAGSSRPLLDLGEPFPPSYRVLSQENGLERMHLCLLHENIEQPHWP